MQLRPRTAPPKKLDPPLIIGAQPKAVHPIEQDVDEDGIKDDSDDDDLGITEDDDDELVTSLTTAFCQFLILWFKLKLTLL